MTISPFEEKENYDIWLFQLQSALQRYDLEDLIDSTIPRPDTNDPEYERWRSLSKFVKGWMAQQLGYEMTRKILGTTWNLEFADDLMNAIEELVFGESCPEIFVKQLGFFRNTYRLISWLKLRVQYERKHQDWITPRTAVEGVLSSVDSISRYNVDGSIIVHQVLTEEEDTLSWDDFIRLCDEICVRLHRAESRLGI